MYLTSEVLPEGSFILRGFPDQETIDSSDIELVVVLKNLGGGIAELSAAKGSLSSDMNILIGLKAIELGFKRLQFSTLRGSKATRWAKKIGSDDSLDHYTIDLQQAQRDYLGGVN